MAKLPACQFIQITVDGKTISGSSEESQYKEWLEGYAPTGVQAYAGVDGAEFDVVNLSVVVSSASISLYEAFLKRGHKKIDITTVVRNSDKHGEVYDSLKVIYCDCKPIHISIEDKDGQLFLNLCFSVHGSVEVTMQVPDNKDDKLSKVGPIMYCLAEKSLK